MKRMCGFKARYFGFILLLWGGQGGAQTTELRFLIDSASQSNFWKNIQDFRPPAHKNQGNSVSFTLPAQASIDSFSLRLLDHFHQRSFLLASIDTLNDFSIEQTPADPERLKTITLGPAMRWLSLRSSDGGKRASYLEQAPLRHKAVLKLEQSLLEQAENNGYPFASVWLDSVLVTENGQISAVLKVERNRLFLFKTLKINGDLKLPKAFLPNYLGIKPGAVYSRTRVLRLREQLRSLLFVESTSNPTVTFAGDPAAAAGEATINLFLKKKRASRFDFLIGLLPQPDAANKKLLITGSLSAAFQNALNLGERFSAAIERLRPETQKIDIQAGVPYILGSSFGAEGSLGIFRRDSTWTDAQGEAGISYLFTGANFVRFFWEQKSSALQKVDTLSVLASRRLPENLDFKQNGFGLEASFSRLDYKFNPRSGWSFNLKAIAGFNAVQRNSQIENLRDPSDLNFSFSSLYDTIVEKAARYRAELRAEIFVPVFTRSTLKISLRGSGIFSEKPVFANENFRLGGNKLLRGFDEERLFATRFVVATAEYRLLIGPNSFLSAFSDWAYLENLSGNKRIFLRPLGLGAGLNFETQAGIFGISAAIGRQDTGQSVDFRATKFHLGYVSLF